MMRLLAPFLPYILGGLMTVITGLSAYAVILTKANQSLRYDLQAEETKLKTCTARTLNIMEDKKRDETVTDPGTYDAPDRWFLPETGAPF